MQPADTGADGNHPIYSLPIENVSSPISTGIVRRSDRYWPRIQKRRLFLGKGVDRYSNQTFVNLAK
jgi:hypothetical protein